MSSWKLRLWRWAAALFATLVILMALVVGLFRLAAPLVPGYRTQLEQYASQALNRPVKVRAMGAEFGWYGPEVTLEDVRIYNHEGSRVVVEAQEVELGLSVWSLVQGKLPRPNRIVLVGPRTEVARDAAGKFSIVGLEGTATQAPTDWRETLRDILSQSATLVVKDGELSFVDARHPAPQLFQRMDIEIRNDAGSHRVSGDLQLPTAFGKSLGFEFSADGDAGTPEDWDWKGRFQGKSLHLPAWFEYWPLYAGRFASGTADLDARAEGHGTQPDLVSLGLGATDLVPAPQAFPGAQPGSLKVLRGVVAWKRDGSGWKLEGRKVEMQRGPFGWPKSDFDLTFKRDGAVEHWSGDAGFMRLQDLTLVAGWLPESLTGKLDRLMRTAPSGDLSDLKFALDRSGGSLPAWSVQGAFQDLGVRADQGLPGFSGVDGSLKLDQQGGSVDLATRDAAVDFRPLFRTELTADALDLLAVVSHDASGWKVATDGFKLRNEDATTHGKVSMQFPADGSAPVLDLDAVVDHADAKHKSAYFPVGIMTKDVVGWLDNSIVAGEVVTGSASIHGKLSNFPFDKGGGIFDIKFHMVHGVLDYSPGWPKVEDLDADVEFLGNSLQADARSARYQGMQVASARARFDDLATGVLKIDGLAKGPAEQGLAFLREGPLKDRYARFLTGLKAGGDASVAVKLTLPVTDPNGFKLDGVDTLKDAWVMPEWAPGLKVDRLQGELHFSGDGVSAQRITGAILGAPMSAAIRIGTGKDAGLTLVTADGAAQADAVRGVFGAPAPGVLTGRAKWHLDGRIPSGGDTGNPDFQLNLRSDLTGIAVLLPAPYGKPADQALQLRASMTLPSDYAILVNVRAADRGSTLLQYARQQDGWQFDRGVVRLGQGRPALPEEPGLALEGTLADFDWDEWKGPLEAEQGQAKPAQGIAAAGNAPMLPAMLRSVELDLGHVSALGQSFDKLHLSVARQDNGWQLGLAGAAVAGKLTLPTSVDAAHPILADFDRLQLASVHPATPAPAAATAAPAPPAAAAPKTYDPRSVPALDLSLRQFRYGDMAWDRVHVVLKPQADGVALTLLDATTAGLTVNGSGAWTVATDGAQHSALKVNLKSTDVEKSLQALGYAAGLTGDKGQIDADLNWKDSPLGDVTRSLGGSIKVDLQDGQLSEVKPGAGRVFGLLSLSALPRRLLLNFSDVFAKGFHYDSIQGSFTVQDGDAYTQDLQLKGPAARISLIGRSGLARHDFDEALIVDPNVGSTLPVVGVLAGGVGVGAVVFLLSEIFKKPITAAGQSRYHLTGTWDNPVLTKVASSAPAPATAAPQK